MKPRVRVTGFRRHTTWAPKKVAKEMLRKGNGIPYFKEIRVGEILFIHLAHINIHTHHEDPAFNKTTTKPYVS